MIDRHTFKMVGITVGVVVAAILLAMFSEWMWPTVGVAN